MNDPLKPLRRRLRQYLSRRRLERERIFYLRKFKEQGLTVPDTEMISVRLRERFPHLSPKPKGTLKIIAVYRHFNWEDYNLLPALRKFGTVRHFDWSKEGFRDEGRSWREKEKWRMNEALLETIDSWVKEERPDVVFMYVSGETVEPATLQQIRLYGIPMVNLALNDKEHFVGKIRNGRAFGARDICRFFDLSWTSTEDAVAKYWVEGAIPLYLPEGANPDIHKPYAVDKTIDVSFVGQCYGNRKEVIDALKRRGIQVVAFGVGWPRGPLPVEEMVKLYSMSRINLGFGGVEGHPGAYCLKGRDFEVPMSGGLYLTEDHPELARVYKIGEEIMTYRGIDDLEQKIRYLLSHPEEAEAIRQRGRARALTEHTWEARMEKVFRLLGLIE
ncbi:MAG TPA: glycosyltransferase [Syntrophales bacterium]|nr:glycosyltransferase [Syntrophales bacterium]HOL59437.1 glycosyltransferase [Syntrophales bacterium]HPO35594.1 glycosyltransferase [Syntrophales bacterium]